MSQTAPTTKKSTHSYVRAHLDLLTELKDREEFVLAELQHTDAVRAEIQHMHDVGVVENTRREVRKAQSWDGGTAYRYVWRVTDRARGVIESLQHGRDTLPCGHRGVLNLGGGEYACGYEHCDARHDRQTVGAYLGVGE